MRKTSSRGASRVRVMVTSRSAATSRMFVFLRLHFFHERFELVEAVLPELAALVHPGDHFIQCLRAQRTQTLAALLTLLDQLRALQIREMFRDCLLRDV